MGKKKNSNQRRRKKNGRADEQSHRIEEEEAQALVDRNKARAKLFKYTNIILTVMIIISYLVCYGGGIDCFANYTSFWGVVFFGEVTASFLFNGYMAFQYIYATGRLDEKSEKFKVNKVVTTVLMKEPNIKISGKKKGGFKWKEDVFERIMAAFFQEYKVQCARSVKDFEKKFCTGNWKAERVAYARQQLDTGLLKNTSTGNVGEKTSKQKANKLTTPQDARDQGLGFQKLIDIAELGNSDWFGSIIGLLETHRASPQDRSFSIPQHLKKFFGYNSISKAKKLTIRVVQSVMDLSMKQLSCDIGLTAKVIYGMTHEDLDSHVDSNMHLLHPGLDPKKKEYGYAANNRKAVLHFFKDRMINLDTLFYDGHCAAMPILIDGESYWADWNVGGSNIDTHQVYKFDRDLQKHILLLHKIDCPGMSNMHYGSQANNVRPKKLDPNLLVSTVFAIFFNTNTDTKNQEG